MGTVVDRCNYSCSTSVNWLGARALLNRMPVHVHRNNIKKQREGQYYLIASLRFNVQVVIARLRLGFVQTI